MLTLSKKSASISNIQSLLRSSIVAIAASAISVGAVTDSVSAISLIGNSTASFTDPSTPNIVGGSTSTVAFIKFTTPNNSTSYSLNYVQLRLKQYTNSSTTNPSPDSIIVSIYSSSVGGATFPDTDNIDLTPPTNSLGALTLLQKFNVPSSSSFTFLPNTDYWLAVVGDSFSSTTSANWENTTTAPSGLATFSALPNGYQTSSDSGNTFTSQTTTFNSFNIDVTPVPFEFEASGGILILGGLFAANKLRLHIKNKSDN